MGAKDIWFRNFERSYNERASGERKGTDEELAVEALEKMRDDMADRIDRARDLAKDDVTDVDDEEPPTR